MCLGVPGKVVEWIDHDPIFAKARIEFGEISRVCSMACVPDTVVGEYVVVHAGIAISRINEVAAEQALKELSDHGLSDELGEIARAPDANFEPRGGGP